MIAGQNLRRYLSGMHLTGDLSDPNRAGPVIGKVNMFFGHAHTEKNNCLGETEKYFFRVLFQRVRSNSSLESF